MRRKVVLFTAAAVAAWLVPWARARSQSSRTFAPDAARTATRSPPEVREERNLLRAAATASLLATRAGSLALRKSASPEVRLFAAGLVRHHENTQVELLRLLQARGMAMPMLDDAQSSFLRKLEKLSGTGFDREFLHGAGPEALRREMRVLEAGVQGARDPAVKAWVDRSLPGLREQLAVAERTERSGSGAVRTAVGTRPVGAEAAQRAGVTRVGTRVSGSSSP